MALNLKNIPYFVLEDKHDPVERAHIKINSNSDGLFDILYSKFFGERIEEFNVFTVAKTEEALYFYKNYNPFRSKPKQNDRLEHVSLNDILSYEPIMDL